MCNFHHPKAKTFVREKVKMCVRLFCDDRIDGSIDSSVGITIEMLSPILPFSLSMAVYVNCSLFSQGVITATPGAIGK